MKNVFVGIALGAAVGLTFGTSLSAGEKMDERPAASVDADNSGVNAHGGLDAGDQSSDPGDVEVTREIRQRIMDQDELSMNAKNIKIITIDRVVTLRGPVDDAEERIALANIAQSVRNVKRVDNQLEIDAD